MTDYFVAKHTEICIKPVLFRKKARQILEVTIKVVYPEIENNGDRDGDHAIY